MQFEKEISWLDGAHKPSRNGRRKISDGSVSKPKWRRGFSAARRAKIANDPDLRWANLSSRLPGSNTLSRTGVDRFLRRRYARSSSLPPTRITLKFTAKELELLRSCIKTQELNATHLPLKRIGKHYGIMRT